MRSNYILELPVKGLELLINIIVVVLYRNGDEGYFMGASYNRNHGAEALAAGIFIGYLIYNIVQIISIVLDNPEAKLGSISYPLMNFFGALLWVTTGGVIIQFWLRYLPSNHFTESNPTAAGIAMGVLSIINAVVYAADSLVSFREYNNVKNYS